MSFKKIELPLEVVILLIAGMALVITGLLLHAVWSGTVQFYENGFHGLLLVIFALQTMMMGKTPFGDMPRSPVLTAVGAFIAATGIAACFIPVFDRFPRLLLIICFGPGGLALLLQMLLASDKARTWIRYGGVFRHLTIACTSVYCLSILLSVLLSMDARIPVPAVAAVVFVDGIMVFYLAGVLRKIYRTYPGSEKSQENAGLSANETMILLTGIFMIVLGLMLIPVSLGLLPFSASAQVGLLMVIFAVQMLAAGSTPVGPFARSWPLILSGLVFAGLGIISCVIPGILVKPLTILVGILNVLGGVIALAGICLSRRKEAGSGRPSHPLLARLFMLQLTTNILTVMFGVSMFIPGLVHGSIVGMILAANGGAILYLLRTLVLLGRMQTAAA